MSKPPASKVVTQVPPQRGDRTFTRLPRRHVLIWPDQKDFINGEAYRTGKSRAHVVREAVIEYFRANQAFPRRVRTTMHSGQLAHKLKQQRPKNLQIMLVPELLNWLERRARECDVTLGEVLRSAITHYRKVMQKKRGM